MSPKITPNLSDKERLATLENEVENIKKHREECDLTRNKRFEQIEIDVKKLNDTLIEFTTHIQAALNHNTNQIKEFMEVKNKVNGLTFKLIGIVIVTFVTFLISRYLILEFDGKKDQELGQMMQKLEKIIEKKHQDYDQKTLYFEDKKYKMIIPAQKVPGEKDGKK